MTLFVALFVFGLIFSTGAGFLLLGIVLFFQSYDQISLWIQRATENWSSKTICNETPQPQFAGSSLLAIFWCLVPTTVVMASFAGSAMREWKTFEARKPSPKISASSAIAHQVIHVQKRSMEQSATLPDWIKNGNTREGDVICVVKCSGLWSSEAEAIQDLRNQATELITSDFQVRHAGLWEPKSFNVDRAIETMVKQIYIEQIEQDFKKFTAPMYRAWWQVELSPLVRTEFYPEWKSALLRNRIIVVGAVFSLITLLASSVELYGRLKRRMPARMVRPFVMTLAPVLLWTVCELVFAGRLMS